MLRKWRSKNLANKGEGWSPRKTAVCDPSMTWAPTYYAAPTGVEGSGVRLEAEKGGARTSQRRRRGEPAEMRERRGLEGRSSRARRALCGVWAGVAVSTWGRGWAPEAGAKYPQTSAPTSGGRRDASEGRPLLNHREAGVGRRRPTGGALHCWIGAGKREKWGTHLAPAAESPRGH